MCMGGGSSGGIPFMQAIMARKKSSDSASSGGLFALPALAKARATASQHTSSNLASLMATFGPQIGSMPNG